MYSVAALKMRQLFLNQTSKIVWCPPTHPQKCSLVLANLPLIGPQSDIFIWWNFCFVLLAC